MLLATLQPQVRDLAQRFIEIETVVRGSDLVGRDIIAQLGIFLRILGIPSQVLTRQLTPDELRILRQEKNSPWQAHFVWTFFNFAL